MTYPPQYPYGPPSSGQHGAGPDQFGLSGQYANYPPPKQKSKLPLILGVSGAALALVVIVVVVLVITLGGGGKKNKASLDDTTADQLVAVLPGQSDLPGGWTLTSKSPAELREDFPSSDEPSTSTPSPSDGTFNYIPARCEHRGFIARGAADAVPPEVIGGVYGKGAYSKNGSGVEDEFSIIILRKYHGYLDLDAMADWVKQCSHFTVTLSNSYSDATSSDTHTVTSFYPGDGATPVTPAQVVAYSDRHSSFLGTNKPFTANLLYAATRGVLLYTDCGNDKKDLLLKLVKQTVDKLNAL